MSSFIGALSGGLSGGAIGAAKVLLTLDTTRYEGQLAAAEGQTASATSAMSGQTTAAGGAMAGAYAAAGLAAVAFAASAIKSAEEHQQVLAALTAQVGDNTQAFEDQATALQTLTGFQDEAILSADTILARFKLTDAQIRQSIPTVLDYARATGKTAPEAASVLGKALLGNSKALRAIGISSEEAAAAAGDFGKLLELVNKNVGGQAAAYAETYAGKLEILNGKFDDLKEAAGGPLIDALGKSADALSGLIDVADRGTQVLPETGNAFGFLKTSLIEALPPVKFAQQELDLLAQYEQTAGRSAAEQTIDQGKLTDSTSVLGDAVESLTGKIAESVTQSKAHSEALREEQAAEQALAGGLTGLIGDMNSLNTAQAEVNKLRRQGKEHTQEYRDATLQTIQAQQAFNQDLAEQAQKMRENDVPLRDIIDRLYGIGKAAGLTRKDIRGLLEDTNGLGDAYQTLRERTSQPIRLTVDTSSFDAANARINALRENMNRVGI